MTGNDLRNQYDFESGLESGTKIRVHWTNNYNFYRADGYVKMLNKASVTVNLAHAVPSLYGGYPEGWKINVPRISNLDKWSSNNGAFPIN